MLKYAKTFALEEQTECQSSTLAVGHAGEKIFKVSPCSNKHKPVAPIPNQRHDRFSSNADTNRKLITTGHPLVDNWAKWQRHRATFLKAELVHTFVRPPPQLLLSCLLPQEKWWWHTVNKRMPKPLGSSHTLVHVHFFPISNLISSTLHTTETAVVLCLKYTHACLCPLNSLTFNLDTQFGLLCTVHTVSQLSICALSILIKLYFLRREAWFPSVTREWGFKGLSISRLARPHHSLPVLSALSTLSAEVLWGQPKA